MVATLASHHESDEMEFGNVYFFYRAGKSRAERHKDTDFQFFYLLLKPCGGEKWRLISLARKKCLVSGDSRQPVWGAIEFCDTPGLLPNHHDPVSAYFLEDAPGIPLTDAMPIAEGNYKIVKDGDIDHFLYRVDFDRCSVGFVKHFHFPLLGSYIIQIKNPTNRIATKIQPEKSDPARLPGHLLSQFRHKPFISKDAHAFLDYQGTVFLLIATNRSMAAELHRTFFTDPPLPGMTVVNESSTHCPPVDSFVF